MRKKRKTYKLFLKATSCLLILTLLWLTVSAPFVYAAQQQMAKLSKQSKAQMLNGGNEEECGKPIGGNEEKSSSNSNSLTEEYLHNLHHEEYLISIQSQFHKSEDGTAYTAFHGELLVPPPNRA
jgi:hypothetical protein